jgi:hypothetical protein
MQYELDRFSTLSWLRNENVMMAQQHQSRSLCVAPGTDSRVCKLKILDTQ